MGILNYTTTIEHQKTVGEITAMLAKAKARKILTEYDGFGSVEALNFQLETEHGMMTFRMPANVQRVYQVIARDRRISARHRTKQQAARVAWRIVKNWLEVQLALIECGMVDAAQVFLPYVQSPTGETLYETLQSKKFEGLALPALTNG